MNFLIIQTAFIGDVVLATPLVEKIRRFFPDAGIDFLVRKGNEKLLSGHPYIRKVLVWDKKRHKYSGLFAMIRYIRREHYDWVINCQRFFASGLLTTFSGARNTSGFDKNPLAFCFTKKTPHFFGARQHPVHEVDRNLALIAHLTDETFELPKLYFSAADTDRARRLAAGRKYACIAPTSVWFTKQFPAHKWVELIGRLQKEGYCIFLLGGKEDVQPCEAIRMATSNPAVYNVAGQLSFLESAALMKEAAMNYANDSAPIHIASAVDAPMAAVFCSTIPAFGFTPLSSRSYVVEARESPACRPCGLHGLATCPKGHFACAEQVRVVDFPI
ncbi:MAG: glycosyltransferase family 9 protein [Lewinellaceae bacterium]|nr:glycosyltransferase family 9 protein [Lewinellaceae bacterium]